MGQPAGPFKIILVEYRRTASPDVLGDPNRDRLQSEVAKLFGVDDETASNILSAMPIVVLDGLDAPTAGVVRNRLQYLTQLGCRITTTDEVSDNIPRVNWPELPPIARVDPGELSRSSGAGPTTPPTRPGTLVCPSCGSGLRLVADGNNTARHAHSSSATRQAPQAQAAPPAQALSAPPQAAPAPPPRAQAVPTPARPTTPPAPAPAPAPRGLEVPLGDDDWLSPGPAVAPAPAPTARNSGRFDNPALMGRQAPAASPFPGRPRQDELQVEFGAMSSGTHKTIDPPTPAHPASSKRDRLREAMGGSSDLSGLSSSGSASPLDMIEDSQIPPTSPLDESSLDGLDPLADPLLESGRVYSPADSGSLLGKPPSARMRKAQASEELDDLDDLLLDSEGSSASADMPKLEDSQDPSLEDVLGMFGPEDEEPLDDGSGLDPVPLDLSSASRPRAAVTSAPFDDEVSDILEPLDPEEARQIMRSHSGRQPAQQRASTASHLRLHDEPSDLEPLDPSEAFAILGGGDRQRVKTKAKSRGVPQAATDEDVDGRRSSTARKKSAKHTDPFGRARRDGGDDNGRARGGGDDNGRARGGGDDNGRAQRRESTRARSVKRESARTETGKRSGRNGRPAKSGRTERPSGKTRRASGSPPPMTKGDHGLVLSRLADPDKKDRAAALIAEIKGCSLDDANRLTERTIIPVLKGVSREVAEFHLERFKDEDIAGRVTTRQRS